MNEDIISKISAGPYQWGIIPAGPDQAEIIKAHFDRGSGDVHTIILPSHPDSDIGPDPMRPNHAALLCMTGNGPNSEANAKALCCLLTHRDIIRAGKPRLPIPTTPDAVAWAEYAMGLEHALGIADPIPDSLKWENAKDRVLGQCSAAQGKEEGR